MLSGYFIRVQALMILIDYYIRITEYEKYNSSVFDDLEIFNCVPNLFGA